MYVLVECQQDASDDHPTRDLSAHSPNGVHDLASVRMNSRVVESLSSTELLESGAPRHAALPGIYIYQIVYARWEVCRCGREGEGGGGKEGERGRGE